MVEEALKGIPGSEVVDKVLEWNSCACEDRSPAEHVGVGVND